MDTSYLFAGWMARTPHHALLTADEWVERQSAAIIIHDIAIVKAESEDRYTVSIRYSTTPN
jgi:hypothetical protein